MKRFILLLLLIVNNRLLYRNISGEDLTNRWVTSTTAVRCLLMPTDFLFRRHNQTNIWTMTLGRLNNSFADLSEIEERLFLRFKWYRYKRQLYEHVRCSRSRKIISTKPNDVPRYWQINRELPAAADITEEIIIERNNDRSEIRTTSLV